MLYLHIFGGGVEERFGHVYYLLFYCVGGVLAVFVQTYTAPLSTIPMIGASGAVAAVAGAYAVFFPVSRVLTLIPLLFSFRIVRVPAGVYLLLWFALQIISGVYTQTLENRAVANVAWWAHAGGFAVGVAAGAMFFFRRRRRRPRRVRVQSQLLWQSPRSALR
jgi:membrane associated rhomboid family serine protease